MYTFYAGFKGNMTVLDIRSRLASGDAESFVLNIPVYVDGDANNDLVGEYEVRVIAPIGYTLTNVDRLNIDELLADKRRSITRLSVTDIETQTGFDRSYIKAEIKRGNLAATKIGNSYSVDPDDFRAWMNSPRRGSRTTSQ